MQLKYLLNEHISGVKNKWTKLMNIYHTKYTERIEEGFVLPPCFNFNNFGREISQHLFD